MKTTFKILIFLPMIIILTVFSTAGFLAYLRLVQNQIGEYDYIIFQNSERVLAKNGRNGKIDFSYNEASLVINQALDNGNSIYIKSGEYTISSNIILLNKKNALISGDAAVLRFNGSEIIIKGDNYTRSQYNTISGLEIFNGTLRIENSFQTTIENIIFKNCSTAIELINTNTWSEGTKIRDCHCINSGESLVFRTPTGMATGSYANTEVNRCFFNLYNPNSTAINVEPNASFTDSLIQNVRIWIGEFSEENQTGINLQGSMLQTLLQNIVFESFSKSPLRLFGIQIGKDAEPPILGGGVNFLGNWSARIHNPFSKWIFGLGGTFKKEKINPQIGLNSEYGETQVVHTYPLEITSFKARIQVNDSYDTDIHDIITIRLRLEFIDNTISESVEKSFNQTSTAWLNDEDFLLLAPANNLIWAILIDAKSSNNQTSSIIKVDLYGTNS